MDIKTPSTNTIVLIVLTIAVLLMGMYIVFWPKDDHAYIEAEKRSNFVIDSLTNKYDNLELKYDSLDAREELLAIKDDSLVKFDTVVVEGKNTRNEKYEVIYTHLDNADRDQRYDICSDILTTF